MKKIKKIHKAVSAPVADLTTFRALPTGSVNHLDPFLFLNHHGPQQYGPENRGLPFGPHPHRGFETLTFILQGDIVHQDSGGGKDTIQAGGVQWMTAGRGVIHTEISSEEFKEKGGMEEVIQLWLNLPANLKMTQPAYTGLQKDKIPAVPADNGKVIIHPVSGNWENTQGPIQSLTGIEIARLQLKKEAHYTLRIPAERNILFYVVNGEVRVNGSLAVTHNLVEFSNAGEEILIVAMQDSELILGHGQPYNEPIVAHGPFVMNSEKEIMEAMRDYQMGKMGIWTE
ncbi:pirin family protein [Adhaeribacter sp. BT258]|uniref:Pirin family protein n=1 Tax=Adhaeribacter terrigena TaxID=2793070 RepID=A0ABS1BZ90_9BACT|nr:pirin family protein [Adhaeribacter terrigena]MBK0402469.1 pirin family protein [Adhaeribacter terrigena]